MPELALRVILLGIILAVVMGAASVYVGLKAGMTVSTSIPAAVMSMLLFRWLFKNSRLLGILFMIPMRRVFVVDNKELPYPEGVACAAVLKAGERQQGQSAQRSEGEGASLLFGGALGATFTLAANFFSLISSSLETATAVGSRIFYFGGDLSPMLVAIGFIVRLNVAVLIFIGGALAWLIGIPLLGGAEAYSDPVDGAYDIWAGQVRYVGVGAMVIGGFSSLVTVRSGIFTAVRELRGAMRAAKQGVTDDQRDLPATAILLLSVVCTVMLTIVIHHFTGNIGMTALATVVMLVMSFFFTAVACHIVGLVGNSNSPVSGMTITAVLVTGGMLWLFGYSGTSAMVATLGIAAVVCCVACTSGDVCNDLKTGSLVGSSPFRQQIMQIVGVGCAAMVMSPVLSLLHHHTEGGIGGPELPAPQASLFQSLVLGFAGETALPWGLIAAGAGAGVIILVIDYALQAAGFGFRAYLMPIAVGMYLPFGLATPILIGGVIAHLYSRKHLPAERD